MLRPHRRRALVAAAFAAPALLVFLPLSAADQCTDQANLVANFAAASAAHIDANLGNAWGLAFVPNGFVFIANNKTGTATSYDGSGIAQPTVITIASTAVSGTGNPTGLVYNPTPDFQETGGIVPVSLPATLIFSTEDGQIVAWNATTDGSTARPVADNSGSDAIYKGIALANNGAANFLYATDFHNGKVDVFNATFGPVTTPGGFADKTIPKGFAPFGIQNVGGALYVTYAKQDAARHDDVHGRGLGIVNVFDANGFRLRRFTTKGHLNAPWGVALAPPTFGGSGNRLLVGNFGDGTIAAFDLVTGRFAGQLRKTGDAKLSIDGLWGLAFGNDANGQSHDGLYFTAGPSDEIYGLYGRLTSANCAK